MSGKAELHLRDITEATEFFMRHREATQRSCTTPDLIAKVIEAKKLSNRSQRYLADLRPIGGDFARTYPHKFVVAVTPEDVYD